MSPQTVKMLVMFLLAAALLNMTNYLFYWLYEPPPRQAMRVEVAVLKNTEFLPKRRVTRIPNWSKALLCENASLPQPVEGIRISGTTEEDYRDNEVPVNADPNAFYYYNGPKKGDKFCPEIPPGLGPLKIETSISTPEKEKLYNALQPGGYYEETECVARQSVAVILNEREHENELIEFVNSIHSLLIKQQLEHQIFVVKQTNKTTPHYPGKLLNVGYIEARGMKKTGEWHCLVFHEQIIVPVDSRNLYRCSDHPQQLVTRIGNRSYEREFGGAFAVKPEQFVQVNGFSNSYLKENDAAFEDFYKRLVQANYTTTKSSFGKYEQLKSSADYEVSDTKNRETMSTSSPLHLIDGLSTLSYTITAIDMKPMYTLIDIDIDKPQLNSTSIWERLFNEDQTTTVNT